MVAIFKVDIFQGRFVNLYTENFKDLAPDRANSTCEKYGAFLNSFQPDVKRLDQIKDKNRQIRI